MKISAIALLCISMFLTPAAKSEETKMSVVREVASEPIKDVGRAITQTSTPEHKKPIKKATRTFFKEVFSDSSSLFYIFLMAFFAGWLVSFTPCIYPMIPITASVISGGGEASFFGKFIRSLMYILGVATIYSSLGYASAKGGLIFGQWLSNPWLVSFLVLFFIYLAFSMFGFYELSTFNLFKTEKKQGSGIFAPYLFGLFSGTAASPCISPPLALLLGFVAKKADPLLGFALLFTFAIGMGSILVLIGTFAGTMTMLPKPGSWMFEIKKIFGFAMLFAAINFTSPFFAWWQLLIAYGLLCLAISIYYFVSSRNESVLDLIKLYKERAHEKEDARSGFHGMTLRTIFKKLLALAMLSAAIYFLVLSYLTNVNQTLGAVIIKLLR